MNTAIFELIGKLAAGGPQSHSPSPAALVPLQTSLPTDEDCSLYSAEAPILFFFDPLTAAKASAANFTTTAAAVAAATTASATASSPPPGSRHASSPRSAGSAPTQWVADLASAIAHAAPAAVKSFCVAAAEDDATSPLPCTEVWSAWPQVLRGWQLCPVSHVCAVLPNSTPSSASCATSSFYLMASRYELVGTSAVYERYLLLSAPAHAKGCTMPTSTYGDGGAGRAATSISVHELRALPRLACLCRCFCSNGCEVQPRAGGALAHRDAFPPPPPADFFLRLVPTSLHFTFCRTTTALLTVAEEERCHAWAAATAQLGNGAKAAGRYRSCSTEAANTSGALSDGGHTVYQDSSFTRERSGSTVRLVDGAAVYGHSEDPRSATSTPARPVLPSRLEEQQQAAHDAAMAEGAVMTHGADAAASREAALERRLPQSQRWRALSLLRLVDTSYYDPQVPAGWRRWRYASSGILCRPLVVDSLDGIVRYIHGSRLAFYTAVAFLDRFIAATVDPLANFQAYRRQLYRARVGQEMDFSMMRDGAGAAGRSEEAFLYGNNGGNSSCDDDVHARDICSFLTQVIVVCIMLGSKTVDLYPPRIRQLMGCVEDTAPISEHEFVILELHVLLTLGFPVHPVTLFESVNALLTFSTSDELFGTLTASHTTRRLLEEYQDRGHLVDDVDKLFAERAEKDEAAAVRGIKAGGRGPGAAQASHRHADPREDAGGCAGRSTASLTVADRQAMNDWLKLRLFTYFICDEVIRADAVGVSKASSAASSVATSRRSSPHHSRAEESDEASADGDDDDSNVLQYAPILVAAAALVTAAEQLCMPLPTPLLRLVPQPLRDRLREIDSVESQPLRRRFACNEESNPVVRDGPAFAATSALRLIAQPCDDHYAVLEELSVLLEVELVRLSDARGGLSRRVTSTHHRHPSAAGHLVSPTLAAAGSMERENDNEEALAPCSSSNEGDGGAGRRRGAEEGCRATFHVHRSGSDSSSRGTNKDNTSPSPSPFGGATTSAVPRADPYAVALLGQVIRHVKTIHERSRESCPPVLLQRYQPLFREAL